MRFFILLQFLVFALILVVGGIVAFLKIGADQRRFDSEMQSIAAGEIRPETLIVVRKYCNKGKRSLYRHVVYRNAQKPEINELASQSFYDTAKPGDRVTGYPFPDNYMIPQAAIKPGNGSESARWFFLGSGLLSGIVVAVLGLLFSATSAVGVPSFSQMIQSRRNQVE